MSALSPLQDAMAQQRAVEKWKLASRILPLLKQTFTEVKPGVGFSNERFDFAFDTVENYLPKTVSNSDLPERAQVEILGMLSLTLRQKQVLMNPDRRRLFVALTIGVLEFGVDVLEWLGVTVKGVPIRQYLGRTGSPVITVQEATPVDA